ncbi:MAG TPA: MFS transporter [Caulobacteraceae bacterium]|nr:MFS transporter [Caulobacteraceae bacterium]
MNEASGAPKLTLSVKALYGLGALGTASKMQLFGLVLLFYTQLVGMDPKLVSLALAIALFVDAFWDPIVGQISDNTHSRLGRRHPYIYGAAIPAAICFALIFMPPLGWSDEALFVYLAVLVVAGRMLDSLIEVPGSALMPELTHNYEERTSVQGWRFALGFVLGGAVAAFLGFGLFLRGTKTQPFGQLNMAGYAPYAIAVAVISALSVLISARATQAFVPYLHKPERRQPTLGAIAREIGLALGNRNFVALAVSALIFGISQGITQGLLSFFYTYFWEMPSSALLLIRLSAIPAGLLGVVLAPFGVRLWGKKRACLGVFYASILSTTIPLAGRLLGVLPPNHTPAILAILIADTMATSALAIMGFVIVTSMIGDVTEDVQVRTGRRSEGLLFAVDSLLRKLSNSFAVALPGVLLAYVGLPKFAKPGQINPQIMTHLALIYLPITVGLTLCSTSAVLFYRIDKARHTANLEHIADAASLLVDADPDLEVADGPGVLPRSV